MKAWLDDDTLPLEIGTEAHLKIDIGDEMRRRLAEDPEFIVQWGEQSELTLLVVVTAFHIDIDDSQQKVTLTKQGHCAVLDFTLRPQRAEEGDVTIGVYQVRTLRRLQRFDARIPVINKKI